MIGTIKIFRCKGKINNRIVYKINVAAHSHKDAERICKAWLKTTDVHVVLWECRLVSMDNPIYTEVTNEQQLSPRRDR